MIRNSSTSRLFALMLVGSAGIFGASPAAAQDYPSRLIRIVVANASGTAPDTVARIMAEELPKHIGQQVIVENRPGANMVIGYEYVAKTAPADGYTMALVYPTALATLPVTVKELRFDPLKDLPPVIGLGEGRLLIGSASKLPWNTFKDMVAGAKAAPGKLNYGSPSTAVRFTTEAMTRELGINITHVPYSAAAAYYQAIAVGEVDMGFISEATANTFKDRLRILAVTGQRRLTGFPDAPTLAELGLAQIGGLSYTLNVAAGTPKAIVDKLHAAGNRALQQTAVKERFLTLQLEMFSDDSPAATAKRLADEGRFFADVAQKMGFKPQ